MNMWAWLTNQVGSQCSKVIVPWHSTIVRFVQGHTHLLYLSCSLSESSWKTPNVQLSKLVTNSSPLNGLNYLPPSINRRKKLWFETWNSLLALLHSLPLLSLINLIVGGASEAEAGSVNTLFWSLGGWRLKTGKGIDLSPTIKGRISLATFMGSVHVCEPHTHTIREPIPRWHVDWNSYILL